MVSPQNYKFNLSSQTKIHPVFNICNLKLHYEPISDILSGEESLPDIVEDIEEWEVEDIIGEQWEQYLVRWKGYPDAIWENKANLKNAPDIVKKWKEGQRDMNND